MLRFLSRWLQSDVDTRASAFARTTPRSVVPVSSRPVRTPLARAARSLSTLDRDARVIDLAAARARSRDVALQLGQGRLFPQSPAIAEVFGRMVTRAGLTRVYAHCLPGTVAVVSGCRLDRSSRMFEYAVDWLDNDGRVVSQIMRTLKRHADDALELHSRNVWVDPAFRGRAVSVNVHAAEIALLRALSVAPGTRITLRAGWMIDPNDRARLERLGIYTWACMGYDFADRHGLRSEVFEYGPRCQGAPTDDSSRDDLSLMKEAFLRWLVRRVECGQITTDDPRFQGMLEAMDAWRHPWEVALLQSPGLELEGRGLRAHVGKAFLLSPEAPAWDAVFLVNRTELPGFRMFERYRERHEDRARSADRARARRLSEDLRSEDSWVRGRAIESVGRTMGAAWAPSLERMKAHDPVNGAAIERALQRLNGERRRFGQRAVALDPSRAPAERAHALDRLSELEGASCFATFQRVIRQGEPRAAELALRLLYEREREACPTFVREEARAALARYAPIASADLPPDVAFLRGSARVILTYAETLAGSRPRFGVATTGARVA